MGVLFRSLFYLTLSLVIGERRYFAIIMQSY